MQFIFEHNTNAILPFLQETGRYLQVILPPQDADGTLPQRCSFILTELCTNGIKHSGTPQSLFDIYIENNHLVIKKTEQGLPFNKTGTKNELLSLANEMHDIIVLTEDDINRLNMQRINENSIRFFVEEVSSTFADGHRPILEHFGLIIICRSSDTFTYTHLPDGRNVFTVTLKIE